MMPYSDSFIDTKSTRSDPVLMWMTRDRDDSISMASEFLNDFFGLKIPQIDKVILRTADDPLARGNRKGRKNTVRFVAMTDVGLETFAWGMTPETKLVVKSPCQNELSVGRELDKRYRRIIFVEKSLQTLASGRVPDANQAVVRGWDDQRTVSVESNRRNRIRMGGQGFQALAASHVPDPHTLVEWPAHNQVGSGVEVAAEHKVGVSLQSLDRLSRGHIPNPHSLVIWSRA